MSLSAEAQAVLRQSAERDAKAESQRSQEPHTAFPHNSDLAIHFDPIQIGPEEAFKLTDHWAVRSGMQVCEEVK
jgi:hypothetical protein